MSAPVVTSDDHPLRDIAMREHTYRRGSSERQHQRAWRAFYKWVCKEGLYGKLVREQYWYVRQPARNPWQCGWSTSGFFSAGNPVFRSYRSMPYDRWNARFLTHKHAVEAECRRLFMQRWDGVERRLLVTDDSVVQFFRVLATTEAIRNHEQHP